MFGQVGIDMIAGPSEILVVCDGQTRSDWIAMDLFSQAEHDEDAQSILVSPDAAFLDRVADSIARLLPTMERAEIIRTLLEGRGALIQVADQAQACAVANRIAPEHLELSVADPESWLPEIRHAGAIFLGCRHCRGPGRLLRRPEPRAADLRYRAFLFAAGGYMTSRSVRRSSTARPRALRSSVAPLRCWLAASR